jgi:hypothetical protein
LIPQRFRIGINGYYLRQVSETEYDGVDQIGSKEKVLAIGPGMLYSFNKDAHLFVKCTLRQKQKTDLKGKGSTQGLYIISSTNRNMSILVGAFSSQLSAIS